MRRKLWFSRQEIKAALAKDEYGFTVRFYRHCGEGWGMRRNPKVSMAGIAKELSISVQQVDRAVAKMKKEKRIAHQGPAKGGSWVVLE